MAIDSTATVTDIPELSSRSDLGTFEFTTDSTAPEALPSREPDDGAEVAILARPGNAGNVFVGNGDVQALPLSTGTSYPGVSFRIEDTGELHIQTPTPGDGVIVLFER